MNTILQYNTSWTRYIFHSRSYERPISTFRYVHKQNWVDSREQRKTNSSIRSNLSRVTKSSKRASFNIQRFQNYLSAILHQRKSKTSVLSILRQMWAAPLKTLIFTETMNKIEFLFTLNVRGFWSIKWKEPLQYLYLLRQWFPSGSYSRPQRQTRRHLLQNGSSKPHTPIARIDWFEQHERLEVHCGGRHPCTTT